MALPGFAGHDVVGALGVVYIEHVRNERAHVDAPTGEQSDKCVHIPVLGPPDVPVRIVVPALLVAGVVPPGSVRAGNPELELLLVKMGLARDVHRNGADDDDGPFGPEDGRGEFDRVRRLCRRGDDHRVEASAAGEGPERRLESGIGPGSRGVAAGPGGQCHGSLRGVEPEHLAPVRPQNVARNLAEQAQPDDAHILAKSRVGLADALHGNRTQRGERGRIQPHSVGDLDHEVLRHGDDARV